MVSLGGGAVDWGGQAIDGMSWTEKGEGLARPSLTMGEKAEEERSVSSFVSAKCMHCERAVHIPDVGRNCGLSFC